MKQDQIFLDNVISLAQALWVFYLLVRKYSRPKAHSYEAEWESMPVHGTGSWIGRLGGIIFSPSKTLHSRIIITL